LRCWSFTRFDFACVKTWLADQDIHDWPQESDHDLDHPIRVLFKALARKDITPWEAEKVLMNLGSVMG